MEKTMMESLKEDAELLATMCTIPLEGNPKREEEVKNLTGRITNIIAGYCAHALLQPQFREDIKKHMAERLQQQK